MTSKKWRKPVRSWGKKRQSISLLFEPTRVQAIDRYRAEQSALVGIEVTRSMVANDWADNSPKILALEKQIKQEKRNGKRQRREEPRIDPGT